MGFSPRREALGGPRIDEKALQENQLEHQEVHGPRIAEAWLGEF